MLKNLINEVLSNGGMSINQLSQKLGMTYANTHALVNREDLSDTKLGNLVDVAKILDVEIAELFKIELADPYDFREVIVLSNAIDLVNKNSHSSNVTDRAYEEFYKLTDDIREYGSIDYNLVESVKREIIDSATYAGYTNIQYGLIADVKDILRRLDHEDMITEFNQGEIKIICSENGGNMEYGYNYFKEEFENWARNLGVNVADVDHLRDYVRECGYNVKEIIIEKDH